MPSAYVLRDLEYHVAAANKRVPRFLALHLSRQCHQGVRYCCPLLTLRDLICSTQGQCTIFSPQEHNPLLRTSLSRAKSCRPRCSIQQMVSGQTARLEYVPTLFAPRPNPESSSLITCSIPGQFSCFCSTGSKPQTSQRQLHRRSTLAWEIQWDWSDCLWRSEWKGRPNHRS